jgi:hypothetical protein
MTDHMDISAPTGAVAEADAPDVPARTVVYVRLVLERGEDYPPAPWGDAEHGVSDTLREELDDGTFIYTTVEGDPDHEESEHYITDVEVLGAAPEGSHMAEVLARFDGWSLPEPDALV